MEGAVAELIEVNGVAYLKFRPHGYVDHISLPVITSGSREETGAWTWNGSLDKPTLKPSIKTVLVSGKVSHVWLTDGITTHLDDCTDGTAGGKFPLQSVGELS